jgi:tetratricopeptide (TPR) repeat protein
MSGKIIIGLICTVFVLTILPMSGHALTPSQVFDQVKDSVVVVVTLDAQGKVKSLGSGVLLSSGRVATNCHVVEDGVSYRVGRGDQLVSATLYAEDADKDICILNAKGLEGKPAQLGKATNLKVGDPVYAVGAPQGLELSLSDGIVAQLRGGPPPFIQTTAAISPGSSGGGLFDKEGRLVGLTTLYIEGGQNLNFAMPVEWIGAIKPGRKPAAKGISQTEWEKRAIALETTKDWQGLLDWCRKWTKTNPKNSEAWYGLGIAYADLKRYTDAIEAFRQALRIDPKDAHTWYNLGYAYDELSRYTDAIEAYRQALRIDPEYADTWYNLGLAYGNSSRYTDAIEAFRQALRIDPEYAKAWNNLGIAYADLKRYTDAIEAFRQALRIDPKDARAWYNLGVTYALSGNRTSALDAVRELRRLDPTKADKLFNLIVPR